MNYAKTISIAISPADVIGACAVVAIVGVAVWAVFGKRGEIDPSNIRIKESEKGMQGSGSSMPIYDGMSRRCKATREPCARECSVFELCKLDAFRLRTEGT